MWTSNNWFSYRRDDLENALAPTQVDESVEEIDEARDPWKKPRKGTVAGNAAEHRKKLEREADSDPEQVKKTDAIGNKNHQYGNAKVIHKETGIDEASMAKLASYSVKASDASKHKELSTDKKDKRYQGVKTADEKIRKQHGLSSTAKVASTSRSVTESYLTEGTTNYGNFELSVEPRSKKSEGHPSHVIAHVRKMNKLGVPAHDNDDYGDTVAVRVKNTKTGASTLHHVYQRGKSSRDDESTKRLVSVRPAGPNRLETHEHNEVIMNYLSGKRSKAE